MLLNEAYYGKDRILLECEKQIEILMREAGSIDRDKNTHPANKKLQELLSKKFNVEATIIDWLPSATVNGYTHPITCMLDMKTEDIQVVRDGKSGVRFKNSKNKIMTIAIYEGLAQYADLTAGEVLSVILHEIGHNFFALQHTFIINKVVIILDLVINLIKELIRFGIPINTAINFIIYSLYYMKPGRKWTKFISDHINQNPAFAGIANISKCTNLVFEFIIRIQKDINDLLFTPITMLLSGVIGIVGTPVFILREMLTAGYTNEKFADNFATSYGYGPETASAEAKMQNYAKTNNIYIMPFEKTPIGMIYNWCQSIIISFVCISDPHPMTMTRVNDQINLLKKELEKPHLSSTQKNIIKKDIHQMEMVQRKMTDTSNKIGTEPMNKLLNAAFGGDPRELFLKTNDYDKRDDEVFGWREDVDLLYFEDLL